MNYLTTRRLDLIILLSAALVTCTAPGEALAASVGGSSGIEIEGPRDRRGLVWGFGLGAGGTNMQGARFLAAPRLQLMLGAGIHERLTVEGEFTLAKYIGPSTGWNVGGDLAVTGFVYKGLFTRVGFGMQGVPRDVASGDTSLIYGIGGDLGLGYEIFVNNTVALGFGLEYDMRYAGDGSLRHGGFGGINLRFY
ncbi:MAG: hypothetical protein ACPHRO_01130 [Nannocystaceae bacterium]